MLMERAASILKIDK